MSWLVEADENSTQTSDDKWLKIPDPETVNKSSQVTIRILASEPEDTWRHWLDNRVFNCPGIDTCPVCKVRNIAMKVDKEAAQKQYKTDHRFFFPVLFEGKVKIYGFGSGVAKQLKVLSEKYEDKYGDLTAYDVTVIKRRTGKLPWNVEYSVLPEVPPRELTEEEQTAAETLPDLAFVRTPASREDLLSVAQGEMPAAKAKEGDGEDSLKVSSRKATKADMILLKSLIEAKHEGLTLGHFGFVDGEEIDKNTVDKLIEELQHSK